MTTPKTNLKALRKQIDQLDDKISALLEQRAQTAKQIGEQKQQQGESYFYQPEREIQVLRERLKDYCGLFNRSDLAAVYRAIFRACMKLQKTVNVGYLGPEGTFSQAAVIHHFGEAIAQTSFASLDAVFKNLEAGQIDYAVVPIENSTTGVINAVLDHLIRTSCRICAEIQIPIKQNLLSADGSLQGIKKIYAHEQSLWQCQNWLTAQLPNVEKIAVSSNAYAAELAAKDNSAAALAGELAARKYKLKVLSENIADNPNNTTRFLVLGEQQVAATGRDKTSIVITTPHAPGALLKLMQPLASHQVNVTAIASRPYQLENWSYVFFLDLEGHETDVKVKKALMEMQREPVMFKILGSYPRALEG